MRNWLFATMLALAATPSLAADPAVTRGPLPEISGDAALIEYTVAGAKWSGCYAGAELGGVAGVNRIAFGPVDYAAIVYDGLAIGILGGCDWQPAGSRFVIGIQGDYLYTAASGESNFGFFSLEAGPNWQGSLAARGGYLINPETLAYVGAGWAWQGHDATVYCCGGAFGFSDGFSGPMVLAGVEMALSQNLFLRGEGRAMFYGSENYAGTPVVVDNKEIAFLIGLTYRFAGLPFVGN